MVQAFFDNYIFLYIMGGLCGIGVFIKCFLLVVYNKLIKASESMPSTEKSWLKNMRLGFESSYQLQLGVNDVDTYVDKYVSKIKYGGLLLSTWENLSGQTIGLCLLTGSFAGILGFVYECGQGPVLFTFFSGAWGAIIVNIVDNVVNISAHKQMLRYNLIDYFENNLKVRMEQEVYHPEAHRKYQRQNLAETSKENKVFKDDNSSETNIIRGGESGVLLTKESDMTSVSEHKEVNLSKKEIKRAKVQAKIDAKAAKKVKKQEERQAKLDAIQEKKQARLDAIQAKKQAKQDKKQQVIEEKRAKKKSKEDLTIAKEKAVIESMLAKKNAKEEKKMAEKDAREKQRNLAQKEKERIQEERKQKELLNNKAYREKMRLKQEKERELAKRKEELLLIEKSKEEKLRSEKSSEDSIDTLVQSLENQLADRVTSNDDTQEKDNQFEDMAEEEVIALTATSKEEDMLIEEVLKDFLF